MQPFSTPWKHQKTLWFSDVFRGYIKGALGTNELIIELWSFFERIYIDFNWISERRDSKSSGDLDSAVFVFI